MSAPLQYFQTAAEMTALPIVGLADHFPAILAGVSSINDGLGGIFYFDITSALAPNGTTVFAPDVGSGRWLKLVASAPYTHTQNTPASVWTVTHNLSRRPAAVTIWVGNQIVLGDVDYVSDDVLTITFRYNNTGIAMVE